MWRRQAVLLLLGASVAVACLVPDVPLVKSFGDDADGTGGSEAVAGSAMNGKGGVVTITGGSSGDAAAAGDTTDSGAAGKVAGGSANGGSGGVADTSGGADSAGAAGASPLGCGDGTRATGEACDDGNTLACGTCSANCRTATPLAPARGTFSIGADAVLDGETFLLDDGFGAILFEFDSNQAPTSGGQVITFSLPLNVQALRDAIVTAVNAAPGLGITATAGSAGTVLLTNDHLGAVGNHVITDLVSGAAFMHTGMSGGAGHDCPNDAGCFNADSCASAHCEQSVCVP